MKKYSLFIENEEKMIALGRALAEKIKPGQSLYLSGQLGAGKSTLARALLHGLGYQGRVKSPTYTLVEQYEVGEQLVIHCDLYRLADPEELEYLGLRDYLTGQAIFIIEWPERAESLLPKASLYCTIDLPENGVGRIVTLCSDQVDIQVWQ